MRKLKRLIVAILLATTLFLTATFGKDAEEESEDTPILPVYDDSDEVQTLNERRRAHESEIARSDVAVQTQPLPSRSSNYVGQPVIYEATAYTAWCDGCSGITKTGVNLRKSIYHEGRRVIAVDPRWIPLGSIVEVTLSDGTTFEATAQDIGGKIIGNIIDVAHETKQEAYVFGRQTVEVRMIRRGR